MAFFTAIPFGGYMHVGQRCARTATVMHSNDSPWLETPSCSALAVITQMTAAQLNCRSTFWGLAFAFGHKRRHKWNGHFGFWASARNIKTHTLAQRWYDLARSDPHTTIDTRNAVKQMQFWCVWVWLTRWQTFSESDFSCSLRWNDASWTMNSLRWFVRFGVQF